VAKVEFELSDHARRRVQSRHIRVEWIEAALASPDALESDRIDPSAVHALKKIAAMEDRVLRVVYNPGVTPLRIISVHFDRRMRGKL
jgi:hypothetical protein